MTQDVITIAYPANVLRTMWDMRQGNPIPSRQEAEAYDAAFWLEIQHALEDAGQI